MFDLTEFYVPRKCSVCGEEISDRSITGMCKRCNNTVYRRKLREKWNALGLCAKCGAVKDSEHTECAACREARRRYDAARKESEAHDEIQGD